MRFVIDHDPAGFAERVRGVLEDDLANNVLSTVLSAVVEDRSRDPRPLCAYGISEHGEIAAAVLRVPPRPMLCSGLDPDDAERLLDVWLTQDRHPPGINALADTARCVARGWARRTGGRTRVRMRLALHSLREVSDPPRPAPGGLASAPPALRELLVAWWEAFAAEAGLSADAADAAAAVAHRLARGHLWLWESDGGQPVSMVGVNPAVSGVVRVGPVYTPPEHRCRGYASSAVAEVSRASLRCGAHTCMLFTDLANPTSNKIYADVGYRRFAEWEEHEFDSPAGSIRALDLGERGQAAGGQQDA